MRDDFIVREIDEHLTKNSLDALDSLMLRVMKYNRIDVLQVKDDIEPFKGCPSLSWRFKHETGKVLAEWLLILGASYFLFRVIEIITGLEGLLKLLAP